MRLAFFCTIGILCLALGQISCSSKKGPEIKDKAPLTLVKGKVVVDGKPVSGVMVMYTPKSTIAETREKYLRNMRTLTANDGSFKLQTYASGDGIPAGEYGLSFSLVEQTRAGEVQLLAPEYTSRSSPIQSLKVEDGKAIDLGTIELKKAEKS